MEEKALDRIFELWWPELEKEITKVTIEVVADMPISKRRNKEDILDEILDTSKYIARSITRLSPPATSFDLAQYTDITEVVFSGADYNHPARVKIYPFQENADDNELKELIVKKNTIEIGKYIIDKIGQRGVSIEILFYSEYEMFWAIKYTFHKGITYFETYEVEVPEDEREELYSTIWRD